MHRLIASLLVCIQVILIAAEVSLYEDTVGKYRDGNYCTVEGKVENLISYLDDKPADTFTVNNVKFTCRKYGGLDFCYNETAAENSGLLYEGEEVRICYIKYGEENGILRLKIRR